jgi:chemotaxis protein methyltransferase WspC
MNLAAVAGLLERRIGLDPASLGPSAFPAAVADRMRFLHLTDPVLYVRRLTDDSQEFDTLTDRLVVPETWFFRGGDLFEVLARHAASVMEKSRPGQPFRVLSLPCGSGEEPFSVAIAFLEANLPSERWSIDGIDLSPRLIEAARRGVYRQLSFRQTDPGLRDRYFRAVAEGWELASGVRERVRFRVGNVLAPALLSENLAAFDLILCRNLLIYLTADARRRALDNLERLLAPGGVLGVGHAEPHLLAGRSFRRLGEERHFLFQRGLAASHCRLQIADCRLKEEEEQSINSPHSICNLQSAICNPPEDLLARARFLADAGQLAEALAACRSYLEQAGPSADACSLLGVIQQARGERDAAADAFRRALYLDPNHREALTHAMLLAAERGDVNWADLLRERLARSGGAP